MTFGAPITTGSPSSRAARAASTVVGNSATDPPRAAQRLDGRGRVHVVADEADAPGQRERAEPGHVPLQGRQLRRRARRSARPPAAPPPRPTARPPPRGTAPCTRRSAYWPCPGVWSSCETSGRLSAVAGCPSSAAASASAPSAERASSRYSIRCPTSGAGRERAGGDRLAHLDRGPGRAGHGPGHLVLEPGPVEHGRDPGRAQLALKRGHREVPRQEHARPGCPLPLERVAVHVDEAGHAQQPARRRGRRQTRRAPGRPRRSGRPRTTTRALSMIASGSTARTPPST